MPSQIRLPADKHILGMLHDIVWHVDAVSRTEEQLIEIWHSLPTDIKAEAYASCFDTVSRDQAYLYLSLNGLPDAEPSEVQPG